MNPTSWLPLAAGGDFKQHRAHLLADPCISTLKGQLISEKLSLQKYERSETTMLDRWSITVSDIDPDPIRRVASTDGLEVKVAVIIIQKSYK